MTSGYPHSNIASIPLTISNSSPTTSFALRELIFFLRMRWQWIAAATFVCLVLAVTYVITAKPTFVAETQLLVLPPVSGSETQRTSAEDAFIEAQLEIASSSDVLGATARILNLDTDPDFTTQRPSLMELARTYLTDLVGGDGTPRDTTPPDATPSNTTNAPTDGEHLDDQRQFERIIVRLRNMVSARRIGRSMMLGLSVAAPSPEKAAQIANEVARQYTGKNIQMNAQAARQYSEWLEQFVKEQQNGLADAANALIAYKSNPRDQFKLAELESAADARRNLFETTLTRLAEAKQRISYPISDATIVSQATPPLSHAQPRGGLIVAFAGAVGAGAGLMLAMIRHASDRRILRARQLRDAAGLQSVISIGRSRRVRKKTPSASWFVLSKTPILTFVDLENLAAMVAGFRRRQRIVVGVVAVDSGDGATTVARELSLVAAHSGARTLLIDAAAKSASLSKSIAPDDTIGFVDVLDNAEQLSTATMSLASSLAFLPLGSVGKISPAIRLSSRQTQFRFDALKKKYDAVFIDLSAFTQSADANAIAPELDGVLVVTSYGRTSIDDAIGAVDSMRSAGAEVLGAIINDTPARLIQ